MKRKFFLTFSVVVVALGCLSPSLPVNPVLIPETGWDAFVVSQVSPVVAASVPVEPVAEMKFVDGESFPVVQQPSGQPAYVSTTANVVTQFSAASNFGSLGFLAHNYLAGGKFFNLKVGDKITLVYQNKETGMFIVTEVRRFQAVEPRSPYSDFIDLKTGSKLTYKELFGQTYGVPGRLILQTCIAADGNDSWGRLFVIAIPVAQDNG